MQCRREGVSSRSTLGNRSMSRCGGKRMAAKGVAAVAGAGARGAGAEFRLFDMDPDAAARRAVAAGWYILQPPTDKPHGLRECHLIGPSGFVFVPSKATGT